MNQNRIQHPHNPPERNMMGGVPYPVQRVNKEMASNIERLEDECGRLPDLYFRKFRLLEKMQQERPQYPFATNVRLGTNKPVFIQHHLWDKVLKEVYWRAVDFKEEKKTKMALAFHLSKKMKKHMSKKFLVRDELHFYHKLLCIQLSKDLDDTFTSIKALKDFSQISNSYIPPHELKEIRKREVEEREQKEQEEAEKKRIKQLKAEEDNYLDQFFGADEEEQQEQNEGNKSPAKQANNSNNGQNQNEMDMKQEEHRGFDISEMKKYKPIARYVKKMMELNPDSFDTPEIIAMQQYRDFDRKKDILDKLKDTIIKYGGKRKERPSIDNIFNSIYPQQQQQVQQEQENQNMQPQQQEKLIKNEQQSNQEEASEIKQEEQQKQPVKQKVDSQSNEDEIKLIQNNNQQVHNEKKFSEQLFHDDGQMKEEQEEIDYLASSDNKLQDQTSQVDEKKEENLFNENEYLDSDLNKTKQKGSSDDYLDVLASDEPPLLNIDEGDVKIEDNQIDQNKREGNQLSDNTTDVLIEDKNNENKEKNLEDNQNDKIQIIKDDGKSSTENNKDKDVGKVEDDQKIEEEKQDSSQVKEEFLEQSNNQENKQNSEKDKEVKQIIEVEGNEEQNNHTKLADNKINNIQKVEEIMELEQSSLKIENIEGEGQNNQKVEYDPNSQVNNSVAEVEKMKNQIKQMLHQQYQTFDQSVCSIMQVEVSKKRKKKEDQKDTLNEEFLSHIKSLNPQIDPKKMKYENLNELLMFFYNKNQLPQEFDKIFEKTINNYVDFPREYSQIPRVQEVDEDEIEMKGQDLYDLPYETFCFTHGLEMDKFLKKAHFYLSCIVNQDKVSKNGIPSKDLFYIEELFKTYPIARKDNNLFAIYTQLDNKNQQTCARVFNENFINSNDKYRVVSLISKQPIFFFFFEYYQGIWGNRHHLIANSLNSNPITKHYQFNNKIVEKLDWTLKIKKKEKFAYLNETILPTMYMFKGDNTKVNESFQHFNDEKKKQEEMEFNNQANLLNDEFDFEEAVNRREKQGTVSFTKPQQQIFKNMNKCFANYFSQNKLYDVSNKLEYRKSIIEYARSVKNQASKYIFDNKEEDKGKTIDYSSFTKMIKVEEVKNLLSKERMQQISAAIKPLSRKKVIIETSNELQFILKNINNALPQNIPGSNQPPPHGNVDMMPPQGQFRGPPTHNPHMRGGGPPPMMNRQGSNMGHGPYPNYPPNVPPNAIPPNSLPPNNHPPNLPPNLPPNSQQHMNPQRGHPGYNDPNGPQGSGHPPPHPNHPNPNMQQSGNMPPPNMMHHRQGPPQHGMNPNIPGGPERQPSGAPGNIPPPHHHGGQGPPPYQGQPGGSHMSHHHHHSMQGTSSNSQQNTPQQHPQMNNQSIPHSQSSGPGMHHPPGPHPPGNVPIDKQGNMQMGPHSNQNMSNHSQPPPYHQGPPHGSHGYPGGNMQGGPHQNPQMVPGQAGSGQGMGHPPMKQSHGQPNHQGQQGNPGMNHMQPPGPPLPISSQGYMPKNIPNAQGIPPINHPEPNQEPPPLNKKIKPNSPKGKQKGKANPPAASEDASNTPKKKKQTKKKKGQDDPASQSQLSMPNQ